MESTQESVQTGRSLTTALLAFAVFMSLLIGSYLALRARPAAGLDARAEDAGTASRIEQVAVMSESLQTSRSSDFRHAEVAAVMGHGILDLRHADIRAREAVIEAFVLMGHATIRVPEGWTVVTRETILMGALENRTRQEGADPEKKLRIEGLVLMGALTVGH